MPLSLKRYPIVHFIVQYGLELAVWLLIVMIVLTSYRAWQHPIGSTQFQHIEDLARQQVYPQTQFMALNLLRAYDQISYGQYLKIMYAKQYEERQAKQLPAVQDNN